MVGIVHKGFLRLPLLILLAVLLLVQLGDTMKLRYICDCGHENLWPVLEGKISNFICEGCGEFIGAYGNDGLKFADGKGIGLYKKYDYLAKELVLVRYNDQPLGSIAPINIVWSVGTPFYTTNWDGQPINADVTYTTTPNTNYHVHNNYYTTVTYQWHQV